MLAKLLAWVALAGNVLAALVSARLLLAARPPHDLPGPAAMAAMAALSALLLAGPVIAVFVLLARAPLLRRPSAAGAI